MGVKTQEASTSCARPSLYLMCRLASIVQQVRTRLQDKVSQRKRTLSPFGASYHRGTRLRALSDLEKVRLPRRRQTITNDPKSDVHNEAHANYINDLLHDLDEHTQSKALPLTKVAANDSLLFGHSHGTLVEALTEHISLQHVAYLFDLSTFLINRLEAIIGDDGDASQKWNTDDADCKRLKDETYIANLLHLLRRLQHLLFQILVHRSLKRLDDAHDDWQKHDSRQDGKSLDYDWFSEWPSGQRPLSTTWPWNIRPSLMVLWGVCWMFYGSDQGNNSATNDNAARVRTHTLSNYTFAESWPQNLSQTELEQARNIQLNGSVLAYSQAESDATSQAQAPVFQATSDSRRSSVGAAPHLGPSSPLVGQSYARSNLVGTHSPHSPHHVGLAASTPRLHVDPNAYDCYNSNISPAFAGTSVSRDSDWSSASGGNYPTYDAYFNDNADVFPPQYSQPPPQAASPFHYPSTAASIPALEVSPVSGGPSYPPNIDTPTPSTRFIDRRSHSYFSPDMGVGDSYPMSPPSDRQRSTSIATSASPVMAGSIMSTSHSPQTSETSGRQILAPERKQEMPRNEKGDITCDHNDCAGDPPTFRRRCEWNKHMDKHERPYKCNEPGCDKIQGFTYSGGLLRHQREVHKKNATAREPLFCPETNCNRSSGTGFTRKENLNEHMRRRHNVGTGFAGPSSPSEISIPVIPVMSTLNHSPETSRKRKRTMEPKLEPAPEVDEVDFDDSGIADTEDLREQIKRLKSEARDKDRRLDEMAARVAEQSRMIQQLQYTMNHYMGNRTTTSRPG